MLPARSSPGVLPREPGAVQLLRTNSAHERERRDAAEAEASQLANQAAADGAELELTKMELAREAS
jgi:hypothetical protein